MTQTTGPSDHDDLYATSAPTDERAMVLKQGEMFAVFDRYGDIGSVNGGEQGLYFEGTRFLSRLRLRVNGAPPTLLSSTIREDNLLLLVNLTNAFAPRDGSAGIPQGTVHIARFGFLWEGIHYIRLELTNYGDVPVTLPLEFEFDADFADIFEVRGMRRERRGTRGPVEIDGPTLRIRYVGLDGMARAATVTCDPAPARLTNGGLGFDVSLARGEQRSIDIAIACAYGEPAEALNYDAALKRATDAMTLTRLRISAVTTSNEQFTAWLDRSAADIAMMVTETSEGPYPYAGVPWYSTAFGRDGIITALEMLWADPELARGVLRYLAAHQARSIDPERDAQPGKILHETRRGEMANLNEHPFQLYYGSIDVTPLFVMLAGAYYRATGDLDTVRELRPSIEAALQWMDSYGDLDGDGFLEYVRATERGLTNQGWKDSQDSVFHADGSLARGPIALCEVQGYAYAAFRAAAEIYRAVGDEARVNELEQRADALAVRFDAAFWDDELGTYVIALDGDKNPCRTPTSNAGHCLYTGIALPERAASVAKSLMSEAMFSGWGVRTVAEGASRYNPMSYHNGSVWPHDNALIAAGLARYGFKAPALDILAGLFGLSLSMELQRLPELFCGFTRTPGAEPVHYPVACLPQSWAAAAVYMVLGACLGLEINAPERKLVLNAAALPDYLTMLEIRNLRVGKSEVDLRFHRYPEDIGVSVLRRDGELEVVVVK